MADNKVLLESTIALESVIKGLQGIVEKNREVTDSFKKLGKEQGDAVDDQVKKTNSGLDTLRNTARRVFDQMKSDFKALASVESLAAGLKLSSQFKDTIKETVTLSDTIRRLGSSFGIAGKDFSSFQTKMTKGLGDIGGSSEEAAMALQGLSGKGVKGDQAIEYAKIATQLGTIGGERGKSGDIAGSLANVVRSQGKDPNDVAAMQAVAGEVTAVVKATGKSASEVLSGMDDIFSKMPDDLRRRMTAKGIGQLGVASAVGGDQATDALKEFLSKPEIYRAGLEARGFGKVFDKEGGINTQGLKDLGKQLKGIGGGSLSFGATTMFGEGQMSEGLVRLIEKADVLEEALKTTADATRDYGKASKEAKGLQESFSDAINKTKGLLAPLTTAGSQGLTDAIQGMTSTTGGAVATTLGAGALAAVLTGGGLRGVGGALGGMVGGQAKKAGFEAVTGEKVQNVYVVNASEIGGGGLAGAAGNLAGMGGKLGGALATGGLIAGGVATLAVIGEAVGDAVKASVSENKPSNNYESFERNPGLSLMSGLSGAGKPSPQNVKVEVKIETKVPELKATAKKSRGTSQ